MILDIFGYSIHLELRLMNSHLRVGRWYRVDLSICLLLFEDRSLAHTDSKLNICDLTLFSTLLTWGESIFSLKRLLSIIISKSMSTFLPLAMLYAFFSYFSRFISSILTLLYSLFCSIRLISSKGLAFFSWLPPFIYFII
jgi:hypothetical protein